MSEAECMEDYGEILIIEELRERHTYIVEMKLERLSNLRGKYVVITSGKKGKDLYLQDRNISKQYWWTNFLDCAFGFIKQDEAERVKRQYRYNNPRVVKVTDDMVVKAKNELLSIFGEVE